MDPKLPIRATTQEQIPIEDIDDNLVILKDGSCCAIIQVTAMNFSLLSEAEQEATIYAYAALLNSLTFAIQILVRSKQKDITAYLKVLFEAENNQKNPLLKNQISKYRKFVEEMIKKNNVLDKRFYIIIPFYAIELGIQQAASSSLLAKKVGGLPFAKDYLLEKAKMNLTPKLDHLFRQCNRLGIKAKQLETQELTSLFYDIYNTGETSGQRISSEAQYEAPIVQSTKKTSIKAPTPQPQ